MNDETGDLEPIDVSTPPAGPGSTSWPPGWYADPWVAGQYRYWTGQTWSGETHRWGPATGAQPLGAATNPWPSVPTPMSSGYGVPAAPASAAGSAFGPPRRSRGPVIAGVAVLVVLLLISGAVGFAIDSRSHSKKRAAVVLPGPTPTTNGAQSTDADRRALTGLVVRQADVGVARTVVLIPSGNRLDEPTLDLCNGKYPSESLRTARLQVVSVDARGTASLSTEAVLYRDSAATVQAFRELRKVRAACPRTAVPDPGGQATTKTEFNAPPDAKWDATAGVERQAYSFVSTQGATASPSVAVYLRRGRALLGLYFPQPKGAQPAVAGRRSIERIVGLFEARMAKLPGSVVNGKS